MRLSGSWARAVPRVGGDGAAGRRDSGPCPDPSRPDGARPCRARRIRPSGSRASVERASPRSLCRLFSDASPVRLFLGGAHISSAEVGLCVVPGREPRHPPDELVRPATGVI